MRILFLTQVLPYPLDAGPKIRAYYTLRHLGRTHDITLLSFVRPSDTPEAVEHLRREIPCQAIHTVPMVRSPWRDICHLTGSLVGRTPFLIARDWVPAMVRQLEELAQGLHTFDAIHADQLWMAPYALWAQHLFAEQGMSWRGTRKLPITVLDQHNAVFQIPRRMAKNESNPLKRLVLALEARKMARYESRICQQFDHVVWVSEEDRAAVTGVKAAPSRNKPSQFSSRHLDPVIPICLEPSGQAVPLNPPQNWGGLRAGGPDVRRVTFLGGLHWPPNAEGVLWFVRHVWPQVHQAVPDAQLTIIGKEPPQALIAARELDSSIEVTGYVTDTKPYLAETAVFIVPLHAGGGMRVKILDAWRSGLPIVSTQIGAEGIKLKDGEDVLLANAPDAFASAVVGVLRDQTLARRLSAGGRRTLERHYDWRKVYRAWDEVYRS
jgi:glycosyltransferase involved in cell wall biosynthesis